MARHAGVDRDRLIVTADRDRVAITAGRRETAISDSVDCFLPADSMTPHAAARAGLA
jgi:hypothetical protein